MNRIFPFKLIKGSENQISSEMALIFDFRPLDRVNRVIPTFRENEVLKK